MEYGEWEPYYRQILQEFGFHQEEDEAVARRLAELLPADRVGPQEIRHVLHGNVVTVLGNGPNLGEELPLVRGVLVAADEAVSVALSVDLRPALVVTDLDGRPQDLLAANAEGALAVLHAHGDNREAIERWAPRVSRRSLGTTQSRPFEGIFNFGGFTDGDRAVLLADHFGAREIRLLGFDFTHPSPKDHPQAVKRRKLAWAKTLIGLVQERTSLVYPASSS